MKRGRGTTPAGVPRGRSRLTRRIRRHRRYSIEIFVKFCRIIGPLGGIDTNMMIPAQHTATTRHTATEIAAAACSFDGRVAAIAHHW